MSGEGFLFKLEDVASSLMDCFESGGKREHSGVRTVAEAVFCAGERRSSAPLRRMRWR